MIKITVFNGEGSGKIPKSPKPDGSFMFATVDCNSLREAYEYVSKNYSLAKPLELDGTISAHKKVPALKNYIPGKISNITFDVENILNVQYFKEVVLYFKDKKYACILGKTRQWDGLYNFNIRVIMKTNLTNTDGNVKAILNKLQEDIGNRGTIHIPASKINTSYPATNDKHIYLKEKGKILSDIDISITKANDMSEFTLTKEEQDVQDIVIEKSKINQDLIDICLEKFFDLGYKLRNKPTNGSAISFSLEKDGKIDNGYFWYKTNPFIMNHNNKKLKHSIFNDIKKMPECKNFLKDKTKKEQEEELLKPHDATIYKDSMFVNERYLDFKDKKKIKIIDAFLKEPRSVLKLKSAMGTAKSSGIEVVIEKAHKQKKKVIIVSNRISVANDFSDKYNMQTYQSVDNDYKESIIVQYDSLHRFDPLNYDVVIFDEYISLLLHHRSSLTDNANINAVKFKILTESKNVVIADAFLIGYEDKFFTNRSIYAIINDYRDEVDLYEYKNKDFFLTSLVERSKSLNDGEHISASFTSLNVMNVVHKELQDAGVRVVSLSSETNQLTRDIIYKRFKEDTHLAFQVILFTPTLTVGVSNVNNVIAHYHYDTGMSTDVISSLQMIKRSRTAKEIHYYIIERQLHQDTNINSLNAITEENINTFYKNKDKTLLIDIDYETGTLKLTPLSIYINKIEVLNNILENNHGNAFRLLLRYQFISEAEVIETVSNTMDLTGKTRIIKEEIKKDKLKILDEYSSVTWDYFEIAELKNKISEKSDKEKTMLLMSEIQEKFTKELPQDLLVQVAGFEIENDFKFIESIKNMKLIMKSNLDSYAKYNLSTAISTDINSLQNKKQINFLEYMLKLEHNFVLGNSYSKEEIKNIDFKLNRGRKFENFLTQLGYKWEGKGKDKKLISNMSIFKFIEYI